MKKFLLGLLLLLATFGIAQIGDISNEEPLGKGFVLFQTFLVIAIYIYFAVCIQKTADKIGIANSWLAWIPIANIYLVTQMAGKPGWWLLLMFIPFVNIVIWIILWMRIAEIRGKDGWLGITTILPIINLVTYGYLAFSK